MEVLFFQIGVFIIIHLIGKNNFFRLNIITFIIVVFTIAMVKTNPLMILQFITIIVSYFSCLSKFNEKNTKYKKTTLAIEKPQSILEIIIRLIINLALAIGSLYGVYKFTLIYWFGIDGDISDFNFDFDFSLISILGFIIVLISYLILLLVILVMAFFFGINTVSYIEKLFGKK